MLVGADGFAPSISRSQAERVDCYATLRLNYKRTTITKVEIHLRLSLSKSRVAIGRFVYFSMWIIKMATRKGFAPLIFWLRTRRVD